MLTRILTIITLLALVTALAWSKDKLDPRAIMAKSDAAYYYPTAHGLADLAVDIAVDQLQQSAVAKDAKISYYYAGADRQQVIITGLSDKYDALRGQLLAVISPFGDYMVPKTNAATFQGLQLKASQVYRAFADVKDTEFYQLVGTASDKKADVKEFRVLLDKNGLAHEMENLTKDDNTVIARIENTRIGENWQITRVTTRMMTNGSAEWKIDTIEYGTVEGFSLPVRATIKYRDQFNMPIKGMDDLAITFTNYRLNKGIADTTLPKAAPAPTVETPAAPPAAAPK